VTFEPLAGATTDPSAGPSDDRNRFGTPRFYEAVGRAFIAMCAFIPVLWLIEVIDHLTGQRLDRLGGIHPHHLDGIDGILIAPFLHQGFAHLEGNSVPLLLLGTFVLAGGTKRFFMITGFVMLTSGLAVWLISDPNSYTIGASGVIFGYLGYLLARGVVERSLWTIGVAVLSGLLFGWQIGGVLPGQPHLSWQAHLFGFLGGIAAAVLFRDGGLRRRRPAVVGAGAAGPAVAHTMPPAVLPTTGTADAAPHTTADRQSGDAADA
jgi:membrane associated rhomboid family serine protease